VSRRALALGLLVAALFGLGFGLAGPASAHASVVSSDPIDGSRLASVPSVVTITFDEAVGLGSIGYLHVTDQSGRRVDAGAAYHPAGDGAKVADRLRSGLGDGTYTASFRVISADSHPVAGTVRFVVGNGVLSASAIGTSTVDHVTSAVFDIARWISFAGLALLAGSWLILSIWPQGRDDRRARTIVWTGLGVSAAGAAAELLLQGPYTAGTGVSDVANWSLLDATLHTSYGQYHGARLLLLGVSAFLLGSAFQNITRRPGAESLAPLVGGGIALTFSAVGHAATTSPDPLSITADLLHISAMAIWLGGLVMLVGAILPRHEPDELQAVLPVFSRVAFLSVTVLAMTGSYAAWHGVGTVHAIFTTTYGLLVVTKFVLFIGVLLVASLSRAIVQRRYLRLPVAYAMSDVDELATVLPAKPLQVERLRRSVLVEVALAIGVLAATSVLVAQPRGKEAVAIAQQRPASASALLGGGRAVTVTIEPGKHGTVTTTVALSPGTQPNQVTATATLPAQQLGPIPLALSANGTNLYGSSGIDLPAAGNWMINLVITTSQFDATTTSVTIHLY
jgi:copper transport protein